MQNAVVRLWFGGQFEHRFGLKDFSADDIP